MSDGIGVSIHWFTAPWDEMQAELKIASDRATMYALRAVGRAVRAAARAQAPVYSGTDPRAQAERGNLKRSIKASRRLSHMADGVYEMRVMPVGNRKQGTAVHRHGKQRGQAGSAARGVPLYRRQMEEMYGYMRAGMNIGDAAMVAIFEDAYKTAFAKWAP